MRHENLCICITQCVYAYGEPFGHGPGGILSTKIHMMYDSVLYVCMCSSCCVMFEVVVLVFVHV